MYTPQVWNSLLDDHERHLLGLLGPTPSRRKNYRFELSLGLRAGIFLVSLILAFTMGSTSASDPASF